MSQRIFLPLALCLALFASACSSNTSMAIPADDASGNTPVGNPTSLEPVVELDDIAFTAGLIPFSECDSFLDYLHSEAALRVGAYGFDSGDYWGGPQPLPADGRFVEEPMEETMFDEEMAMDDAATVESAPAPQAAGESFTTTNNQVAGVDEADIFKTDGTRILTVNNNRLTYVDVATDDPTIRSSVNISNGWAQEMLLHGDRLLVIGYGDGSNDVFAGSVEDEIGYDSYGYNYRDTIFVTEFDLSDPDNIVEGATLHIDGTYTSSRLIDGTARLVINSRPQDIAFVYPSSPAAEDAARATNQQIVANSTIDQWLPRYALAQADGSTSTGNLVPCERMHSPLEFAGFSTLSVLTLDLDEPLTAGEGTGVLAEGSTVYSSTENMYIATNVWTGGPVFDDTGSFEENYSTAIHQFSIASQEPAAYVASGSVRGHLLNQFSLDEYEGHLRVATTDGSPWGSGPESESFVTTFQSNGEELVQVGQVGGLGLTEQIFAVRFIGDQGYVVTFRQVDPLYVIDLSDPATPTVTGDLHIPGFSSYLHPIAPGWLLGVGQDATPDGFTTGAKVSLFDVRNPADPRELAVFTLADGYSDVEWDHRAFTWYAEENLAIVPVNIWSEGFSGALVLEVTENGITEVGRIDHAPTGAEDGVSDCRGIEADNLANIFGPGTRIQVCGPNQIGGIGGYFCEVFPAEEAVWIEEELDITIDLSEADRLEVCWTEGGYIEPIQRTAVIGSTLWSLSYSFLQANELPGLATTHQLPM